MLISNTHDDEFVIYDEYDFSSGIRGQFYQTYNTSTTIEGSYTSAPIWGDGHESG